MDFASYFQDTTLFVTITVGLFVVYTIQTLVRNLKLPPGPWGLPFVGYKPFMESDQLQAFDKLAKKYGEIFSIKIGSKMNIVLNSYEKDKEVFVKNSDNFTGIDQEFTVINYILKADATMFQDEGESWKEQRRFFVACLRDFGVGRLKTEKNIQVEAETALHLLRDSNGKPVDFVNSFLLRLMTFNVASSVTFGRRFEYEDSKLKEALRLFDEFMIFTMENGGSVDQFPMLRFLPESWTALGEIYRRKERAFEFISGLVQEHEDDFDPNNIRGIVDLYLKKNFELKTSGCDPEKTIFARDNILHNVVFLAMAATEDTSVALSWFLKIAAKYPEAQEKMQEEMDRVIGRQRLPSWTDKAQLPYVEAFLHEAMRTASFLPMGVHHTNYEEVKIKGVTFPRRSIVVTNYWTINHDPKVWGDPEQFRPERFIGEDGKINKMKDRVLSFGSGNRGCPGESLGRMELFIFVSAIVQSFTLRPPPDEDINFDCTPGNQRRLFGCALCADPRD